MDGSPLTRKVAYVWTSDGDLWTGTFSQTQVTSGDTACSVKGDISKTNVHQFILLKSYTHEGKLSHFRLLYLEIVAAYGP